MKHRKGTSTDNSSSSGILLMHMSTVNPEKQHWKQWCDKEEEEEKDENFGHFLDL